MGQGVFAPKNLVAKEIPPDKIPAVLKCPDCGCLLDRYWCEVGGEMTLICREFHDTDGNYRLFVFKPKEILT